MSADAPPPEGLIIPMGRAAITTLDRAWRDFALQCFELEVVEAPESLGRRTYLRTVARATALGVVRGLNPKEVAIVEELERAFYGGVAALYGIVTLGLGHESIEPEEADGIMMDLATEIARFTENDRRRR